MRLPIAFARPSSQTIQGLLDRPGVSFNYAGLGLSREGRAPDGYAVNARQESIGRGAKEFELACAALRRWEMFGFDWVELCWTDAPIAEGSTVAVLASRLGLWSLNP